MPIAVVPYDPRWPEQFERVAADLWPAFAQIPNVAIEHVGSTSVPGLAAKPILDIDIIVDAPDIPAGIAALATLGYRHRGDLGVSGREAFFAPDDAPKRNVYLCQRGTLNLRNHLAVRDTLRQHPELRDQYAAVKLALAADPTMEIDRYIARKSPILQQILARSSLTPDELEQIRRLNDGE